MGERIQLLDITDEVQTPLVKKLLEIIEWLAHRVRPQDGQIAQLKDEIVVLKSEKKRPQCKPSQLDKNAGQGEGASWEGKRPGSAKRNKTVELTIHQQFPL
jgi:hypothetical protein